MLHRLSKTYLEKATNVQGKMRLIIEELGKQNENAFIKKENR